MSTTKEELVAAEISKQITFLEALLEELENEPEPTAQFLKRISESENQLRKLRSQLNS